jgi:mRNA interferase MazF
MRFHFGDIVLIRFPFSNVAEAKKRPALVLLDTGDDDLVVARVTGQPQNTQWDVVINGWQPAGLLVPSFVRLHKIATVQKTLVDRKLGTCTPEDLSVVRARLKQLWTGV